MTRTVQNRLRRQRAKRQAMFLVFGCTAVIALVLLVFSLTSPRYDDGYAYEKAGEMAAVETAGEVVENAEPIADDDAPPLSLGLGGDVSFGLAVADIIAREGPAYPWSELSPLLGEVDFAVANLEGPLCRGGEPNPAQTSVYLKGDLACAQPMSDAGIDAVSLANDHAMDYGAAGLEETLNNLRAASVGAFGAGLDERAAQQPLVLEAGNGARVALVSFCDTAPRGCAATQDSPGVAAASSERIAEVVGEAARLHPYVVVFMHWGEVGSSQITPRQRELALACVQAGADLVAGCHPHVLQGVEVLQGVPVIYSLGNLVFSSESEKGKSAVFARCRFDRGRLSRLELFPLLAEGGRPRALTGDRALGLLRQLSEASPGVEMDISTDAGVAELRF